MGLVEKYLKHNQQIVQDAGILKESNSISPKERMSARVANTMLNTVTDSDGREVKRTQKMKVTSLTRKMCENLVVEMYDAQKGYCSYSGLQMQLDGEEDDKEMLVSLDRIDSEEGYHKENLHLVCRFVNRWKSNDTHELFSRLVIKIQSKALI